MLLLLFTCCCLLLKGVTPQSNCQLGLFSLDDLSRSIWWKVHINNEIGCIFANVNGSFSKASCDMYFSICHPLNGISGCNTNGGACQRGDFNGTAENSDIATYKPINESGSELNSSVGFEVMYMGMTPQAPCKSNQLTLQFACNSSALWNSNAESGSDVPNGADTFSFSYDFQDHICKFHYTFQYDGACHPTPTIGPANCYVDDYNLKPLTAVSPYWKVDTTSKSNCFLWDQCTLFFSLCGELPSSLTSCVGKSVCITGHQGSEYSLGTHTGKLYAIKDKMGFYGNYTGGDLTFLGCNEGKTLTTTLKFICNSSGIWKTENNIQGQQPFNVVFDKNNCNAVYSFYYSGSCIKASAASNPLDNIPWLGIVVIILLFFFFMYWVLGFTFNFAMGKRGKEIIPNHAFWNGGLKLFAGGFVFIFRLISCKKAADVENESEEEPIVQNRGYQTIDNTEKTEKTEKTANTQKYPFGP